jgi:glutaredoxin
MEEWCVQRDEEDKVMKLFIKSDCPDCHEAEARLNNAGLIFEVVLCDTMADQIALATNTEAQMFPVLEQNGLIFSGDDVLIAIEEGELE